jgi:hypothetical protein
MSTSFAIDFNDGHSEIWPVGGFQYAGVAWANLAEHLGLRIFAKRTPFFIKPSNAVEFANELAAIKKNMDDLDEHTEKRIDRIISRLHELASRDDWDAQYG